MKSFDQIGQAAYEAWHKSHGTDPKVQVHWSALESEHRAHWIAVAKQLWAEFSAIR